MADTYLSQDELTRDERLIGRLAACAAGKGALDPIQWVRANIYAIVTAAGWGAAYEAAKAPAKNKDDAGPLEHPSDAITDSQIARQITAVIEA